MKPWRKKVFLDQHRSRYCWVLVYRTKTQMLRAYAAQRPLERNQEHCLGVHCAHERRRLIGGRWRTLADTGRVLLSEENCGAGVVAHELMHAVLWAYSHRKRKEQFPLIITGMAMEEELLHSLTAALKQFYPFYWQKRAERNARRRRR
jgi:hypothetical protein